MTSIFTSFTLFKINISKMFCSTWKKKCSKSYGNHLGTVSAFEYQTPHNKCGELVFTHMQLSLVGWTRPLSLPLLLLRCFQDRFLAPRLCVKFDFLFSGQDISVPQRFRRSVHYISTCYSNGTLLWYFQLWGRSETNVFSAIVPPRCKVRCCSLSLGQTHK